MTVALLPASFDPITYGHVDIAKRAARLFDRLIVAVYGNPKKNVMFSLDERVAMVRESLEDIPGVEVVAFYGLLVDLARDLDADVVVRGLRFISDFEAEYQQAALNRAMLPGLEVISMFAGVDYGFVSSSIIKEIAENGGDVSSMVPAPVVRRMKQRFPQPTSSLVSGG